MAEKKSKDQANKEEAIRAQAEENVNEDAVPVLTSKNEDTTEPVKSTAKAADVFKNAEEAGVELSETEKAAIEVSTGEASGRKYKLADPKTQYGEEGFTLAGDQEKELPANPSDALVARIRSGFIVEA